MWLLTETPGEQQCGKVPTWWIGTGKFMRRKKDRTERIDFQIFLQQHLYVQPAGRIATPELDLWHMKDIAGNQRPNSMCAVIIIYQDGQC